MNDKTCCYCDHMIDQSGVDWGMTLADYSYRWWHRECFDIYERVLIEEDL